MKSRIASGLGLIAILFCIVAACGVAKGDGLIIVENPPATVPGHFAFAPLEVTYHRVEVRVEDAVAITSVDQEFYNPNGRSLEGTYVFPLPAGAHIDKFAMEINGKMMEAELLDANKARSMYEEIVRKQRDPALLEYVGRDAFRVRIFPIEANSKKHVTIKYTQMLKPDNSGQATLTEYSYPLSTEKFSSRPLRDVSVKVTLACKQSIKSVYCPTHNAEIKRKDENNAIVSWEERNARPDTDFKVVFSTARDPVGLNLLTYRTGSDDGYFLLLASPGFGGADDKAKVQPKDICFVLDTSGSMAGAKLDQAKKALSFCLANLNAEDRFEIIRFSTEAEGFFSELKPASKENVEKATKYVDSLKPVGGTAISAALKKAVDLGQAEGKSKGGRPYTIIFLTDGRPTLGETNEDKIVSIAQGSAMHIFPFGIGTDINTHLLDRVANETQSVSQYVLPEEDIEVKVSGFYSKIRSPVLTQLKLALAEGAGVRLTQMYPSSLPDLFQGDTLMVFGRYTGDMREKVESKLALSGTLNGENKQFLTPVTFTASDTSNAFIPRLWATRRVGFLLDELRLRGDSAELKDEVTRLSREHGIVTPYTAYLILEDEAKRNVPLTMRSMQELEGDASVRGRVRHYWDSASAGSVALEKSGGQAVVNSTATNDFKLGSNLETLNQNAATPALAKPTPTQAQTLAGTEAQAQSGYRVAQNYSQQTRVINSRAFYQNGTVWTDSTAQTKKSLKQQAIKFNSDEYFALLKKHPTAAEWFSLGSDVDVVLDDTLYQIRS